MSLSFHVASDLDAALRAVAPAAGLGPDFQPEVRTAEPAHGDFQANGVFSYAKRQRQNPQALAKGLATAFAEGHPELARQLSAQVAGPGFINFRLTPEALLSWLRDYTSAEALREGARAASPLRGQRFIVDYSSPNTAKQMHVGHLRSAVIGEAICRMLQLAGAEVIRDNHLGDWGTQFGKLIGAYKEAAAEDPARLERALTEDAIEEFERLYKVGNAAAEADPAALEAARRELVKLHEGDPESRAVWKRINDASLAAFQKIYDRLGLRFDTVYGESYYNDKVEQIYRELTATGLAAESQGALVVFHPEHPRFATQPLIVRKSDGAANYASTDLATILYRTEAQKAEGALYVVDKRQSDHFEQLFLTAQKWFGKTGRALPRLEHVGFGTVLGENHKPLKTRSGDNIRLKDLLDEAVERAHALVSEKNPELSEAERRAIAEVVGVGSVQYADLSQNRSSDYVFAWDKMISLEGNTAAYLLYAVARIHSIFRKLGLRPGEGEAEATAFETPGELSLARKLVAFPTTLDLAVSSLRPHYLCTYLYELAGVFSGFYGADKVAVAEPPLRARRLLLCARTLLVLETGLHTLGLRTLEKM